MKWRFIKFLYCIGLTKLAIWLTFGNEKVFTFARNAYQDVPAPVWPGIELMMKSFDKKEVSQSA